VYVASLQNFAVNTNYSLVNVIKLEAKWKFRTCAMFYALQKQVLRIFLRPINTSFEGSKLNVGVVNRASHVCASATL
jgi:hypothetical protein